MLEIAAGLRRSVLNWFTLGTAAWVALPSRLPPRAGIPMLARREATVRLRNGQRAVCRLDEFYPFIEVFALQEYDDPRIPWQSLGTIVDVGANVGASVLWFAHRCPQARILAIEPDPRALKSLTTNVRLNHLQGSVTIIPHALSKTTGKVFLRSQGSSVNTRTSLQESAGRETLALTLEDALNVGGVEDIDLLKLDCEGAEFDILSGARASVLRRIRRIIGEYHAFNGHSLDELRSLLIQNHYDWQSRGSSEMGMFFARRI